MPYLETTSSSAVQDFVYKGDRSKVIATGLNSFRSAKNTTSDLYSS
jgi:hypothetical protein